MVFIGTKAWYNMFRDRNATSGDGCPVCRGSRLQVGGGRRRSHPCLQGDQAVRVSPGVQDRLEYTGQFLRGDWALLAGLEPRRHRVRMRLSRPRFELDHIDQRGFDGAAASRQPSHSHLPFVDCQVHHRAGRPDEQRGESP